MATIGNIVIGMSARTDGLSRDLNKAANSVTSFGSQIQASVSGGINQFKLLGAAATAVAASGFATWIVGAGKVVDETGDMADRLGTTTANLMSLQYAAKLTGSEAESLNNALAKMNVNLGDASTKGGPVADALKRIGLDAGSIVKQDPTKAFLKIVDGLNKIPNASQRAAVAVDIFGKGGSQLLGSISAGADELERLSKEFGAFGGGVTEANRQSIGKLFDGFDRLSGSIQGLGTTFLAVLAPAITTATNLLTKFVSGINSTIKGVDTLIQKASGGRAQLANFAPDPAAAPPGTPLVSEATAEATTKADAAASLIDKLKMQRDTYGLTSVAADIYRAKQAGVSDAAIKQAEDIAKTIEALELQRKITEDTAASTRKFKEIAETPLDKFRKTLGEIEALKKSGDLTGQEAAAAANKTQTEFFGRGPKFGQSLELGSQDARKAMLEFRGQGGTKSTQDIAKSSAETARESARTSSLMEKLVTEVAKLNASALEPVL